MTKNLEQKIKARLVFDYEAMAEKYRSLDAGHPAWSESLGMEFGARWQHEKLTAELAPLLVELGQALHKIGYTTDVSPADENGGPCRIAISNSRNRRILEAQDAFKKLEAWLGKKEGE